MRATCALLMLVFAGCGGVGSSTCNPDTYPDDCNTNEGCDAITKTCEPAKSCQSDADCAGYLCTISGLCRRNCRGQVGPDDSQCAVGYICDATLTCGLATSCSSDSDCNGLNCDPATSNCQMGKDCIVDDDCGTYHCGIGGCNTSCQDFTQCGANYNCDSISNTCS